MDGFTGHGGRMRIDLDGLRANYRKLSQLARPAECAAAVKADAYGLGAEPVCRALLEAGCRTFFVAHLSEAAHLRDLFGQRPQIYVLNGLPPGLAPQMADIGARPVLCCLDDIAEWQAFAAGNAGADAPPAAIMIDTGFNRLGLSDVDLAALSADPTRLQGFDLALVLTHLACADEPQHPMNAAQAARFETVVAAFPGVPAAVANSGGIFLGARYHADMVRTGISLFGGSAQGEDLNPMRPVVALDVPVIQNRQAAKGETVGYGATYTFDAPARLALLSIGYADGFFRSLSASDAIQGGKVYFDGRPAPIIGRISMDVTAIDVTALPASSATRGTWAEIIGPNQSASKLAKDAGTIDYELFTRLGSRAIRIYSGGADS